MIDIRKLLDKVIQAFRSPDFLNVWALAASLDLDLSRARIKGMKSGDIVIDGAYLRADAIIAVHRTTIRRGLWLIFKGSTISYQDVKDEIFGDNQRIQPSRAGTGFGVLFEIDGLTCGYTAPSQDGDVDAIFCEEANAG
ncbi:MAG TPA: hypothetical protein VKV77_08295 [Methylovirgula sp.]|nr:hypothetical protein [Methylovirgula sp.]